jgi:WD40-like Beta Propeller Repeat
MRPMRLSLALSLLLFCPALFAQGPELQWRTVTTKHFRVHYPVPYEAWSLRAAARLESIRDAVAKEVGFAPETVTDVLVENPIADANGITLPLLDTPRIILFTESPDPSEQIGEYSDWVDLLTVHEVTHLLHLTRPSRNPLERFAERFLPLNPITLKAPRWVHEGYATVVEGRITGAGRPSSTLRALILRRWAATGNLPTYPQLAANNKFLGMSMAYLMGSAYLEWLEQRSGEGSLRKLWARMTARHRRSFDEAFIGVFGDSPERLYGLFTAELTQRAMNIEQQSPAVDGELWQVTPRNSGDPDVSPDGKSLVIVLRARSKPSRLVVWSTGPATEEENKFEERIAKILKQDPEDVAPLRAKPLPRKPLHSFVAPDGGDFANPRWMPDGKSILYSHRQTDRQGFLHHDLFRWTPETGENECITHLADVSDADPLPDGKSAIAVRSRFGYSQLVMVNLLTGDVTAVNEPSLDEVYSHPRGDAYVVHRPGGGWQLHPPLTTAHVVSPEWSGEALVATVFANGFAELHRFANGNDEQLTRAPGGAFQPAPSPDGRIFFMSLDPDGYVVRVLNASTPLAPLSLAPDPSIAHSTPVMLESREVGKPKDYGIGHQEFATIFGGAYTSSLHATEAGVRFGDVVGKLDTIAVGSLGDIRGGAVATMWRGWPVGIGAHLFSFDDGTRHRGGELRASWRALWPMQSLAIDGGYLADRFHNAAFTEARWRMRQERMKMSEELRVTVQSHVQRGLARASMRVAGYRLAAQWEHAISDDQTLPLGGIATSVMPQSLVAQRIIDPALALSPLIGDRYNGGRVEVGSGYVTAFYQQHRIDGQRLGYPGVEITMQSPPITWIKTPAFDLTIGAARVEGKSRWWAGLRYRP